MYIGSRQPLFAIAYGKIVTPFYRVKGLFLCFSYTRYLGDNISSVSVNCNGMLLLYIYITLRKNKAFKAFLNQSAIILL